MITSMRKNLPTYNAKATAVLFALLAGLILSIALSTPDSVAAKTTKLTAASDVTIPTNYENSSSSGCELGWRIVSSPAPGSMSNYLNSVTAISSTNVWAVGNYSNGANYYSLIEHWDGSVWSVVASPNFGTSTELSGVSAVSDTDIWAVGTYFSGGGGHHHSLILHWDGNSWNTVASPDDGQTAYFLEDMVALSSSNVWAVGFCQTGTNAVRTRVLHWDGYTWIQVQSPNSGSGNNLLLDVAAVSANNIWAVGYYNTGTASDRQPLIQRWDGSQWSIVASPLVGVYSTLIGVAALSANDVWAVGSTDDFNTLIEHFDGDTWSIVPSPIVGTELFSVSMLSPTDVWAVGTSGVNQPLIEHWDGTVWSKVESPTFPSNRAELRDVVALSSNDIWAVGHYEDSISFENKTLIFYYGLPCVTPTPILTSTPTRQASATRTNTPIPPSSTPAMTSLSTQTPNNPSVTPTPAPTNTIGSHTATPTATPSCGPNWLAVSVPTVGAVDHELYDVVSLADDDIWAVGGYEGSQFGTSLALHWDGSQWAAVPVPNYGGYSNYLKAVDASTPDDVWAAGWYYDILDFKYKGLVMHWDGTQWSVAAHLDLGPQNLLLHGITAITPNDVWVVGDFGLSQSVAYHWNGQTWTRTSTPNPGSSINRLSGVDAISK
jgi:hypothetical protein